jgi:hypothetical protein
MNREFLAIVFVLAGGLAVVGVGLKSPADAAIPQTSGQSSPRIARNPAGAATRPGKMAVDGSSRDSIQQWIRNAAAVLRDSPPIEARLRYQIEMFGQSISGPGHYYQAGQGTRKSRIEFEFGFEEIAVSLHQFCDGNMLYTLTTAGEESSLEFVDLRRIDILQQSMPSADRVATWLQVGSLAGLMSQLAEQFEFVSAEPGQLDSIPVIDCVGRWRPEAIRRLLNGQMSEETVTADGVNWQLLPAHLPHQVRLTLGNDERFPCFPYRIVFEQFAEGNGEQIARPIAVLELYEVKQVTRLADDMFRLPSVDTLPVDATEFYEHRVKQFAR